MAGLVDGAETSDRRAEAIELVALMTEIARGPLARQDNDQRSTAISAST